MSLDFVYSQIDPFHPKLSNLHAHIFCSNPLSFFFRVLGIKLRVLQFLSTYSITWAMGPVLLLTGCFLQRISHFCPRGLRMWSSSFLCLLIDKTAELCCHAWLDFGVRSCFLREFSLNHNPIPTSLVADIIGVWHHALPLPLSF
jgi:hypothetical protein